MDLVEPTARLLAVTAAAVLCGGLIGGERELKRHRAGLRTIMLITVGSAILVHAGQLFLVTNTWSDVVRIDATRLASYVIAGIGFLGAGPIVRRELGPGGLTTASTIWLSAAIGIVIGFEMYLQAFVATGVVLLSLAGLSRVSDWIAGGTHTGTVELSIADDDFLRQRVLHALHVNKSVIDIDEGPAVGDRIAITFRYHGTHYQGADLLGTLADLGDVRGRPVGARSAGDLEQ